MTKSRIVGNVMLGGGGGGGGELAWPVQRVGGDAQVMLMAGDILGGTEPNAAFTVVAPGGVNIGKNGLSVYLANEGTSSTVSVIGQVAVGAYDQARWLGGTNGTPVLSGAMNDGFKRGDWAVDYGGSIWINTAATGATPSWVEIGAGGGGGAVDSVDGRTGVVTLGDKYVDVTGDTMTGALGVPTLSATDYISVGTPAASIGAIRLATGLPIAWRHSSDTVDDITLTPVTGALEIAGAGLGGVTFGPAYATSTIGVIRIPYNQAIASRLTPSTLGSTLLLKNGAGNITELSGYDGIDLKVGSSPAVIAKVDATGLNLLNFELRNAVTHKLATAPATPVEGLRYYDTALKVERYWNGTAWVAAVGGGVPDDNSVTSTKIADGTIVNGDIAAGAGIDLSKLAVNPLARANHIGTQLAATISDFDAAVRLNRLDQMATPIVAVNFSGQPITNVATPSGPGDAVNKAYADNVAAGLDFKASVRVAATTAVNLAAPGATIDGVTLSAGNRILVTAQAVAAENGIYVWNGAAVPATRATDADASAEVTSGLYVFVEQGTANGTKAYVLITPDPITLGATDLTFTLFSGGGSGAVSSVDGRLGTVTLGDLYVNVTGDAMSGKLTVAPVLTTFGADRIGVDVNTTMTNTAAESTYASVGLQARALKQGAGDLSTLRGLRAVGAIAEVNTGITSHAIGLNVEIRNAGASSTIYNAYGIKIEQPTGSASAVIGNSYGIHINNQGRTGGGTATGILVGGQGGAASSYGVRIGVASTQTLSVGYDQDSQVATGGIYFGQSADTTLYRSGANELTTGGTFKADRLTVATLGTISRLTATANVPNAAWYTTVSSLYVTNTAGGAPGYTQLAFRGNSTTDTAGIAAKTTNQASGYGELWFYGNSAAGMHPRLRIPETGGLEIYGNAGTVVATVSNVGALAAQAVSPTGLTGATQASRYVGATVSGAPTSGTFVVGDWIVDRAGTIRVCTVAGTPGTWVSTGGAAAPNTGWAVTAGYAADKAFNPESTTLTECARVLGTLIDALKTYGVLAA